MTVSGRGREMRGSRHGAHPRVAVAAFLFSTPVIIPAA
jgi:hypothetical protein